MVLCIFIDSYDTRGSGGDQWLCGEHGLCRNLDRAIFAIFGHEKLQWEGNCWKRKGAKDADGATHGILDCHKIDNLSREECCQFLERRGVPGGAWRDLYERTDGWPELLDKWCKEYGERRRAKGRTLTEEECEGITERMAGWVKEFIEAHWGVELSGAVADAVYLMADMWRWTDELLECAAKAAKITLGNRVANVVEVLREKGLIVEDGGAFSLRMEMIRNILNHNTGLRREQRVAAYKALVDQGTASGAEAAYYMGQGGGLWTLDLGGQLQRQAEDMEERAKKLNDAAEQAKELSSFQKRLLKKQQDELWRDRQKEQQALLERAQGLYAKAVEVDIAVLEPEDTDLKSETAARWPKNITTLIAMNKLAMNCNRLSRYEEALALAERVCEVCKGRPELRKTAEIAQTTRDIARERMGMTAKCPPSRESK